MASNLPGGNAKSDTSRRPPVIKNPLLSSQVTGLTLDDFAPVAVLLPAAPLPTIVRDPTESTGPVKSAIFSAQTIGSGTVPELPQDTDSFSEIDLNATSEVQTPSRPQPVEYNPLQDLEESDGRGPGLDGAGDPSTSASSASYLQQTSALTAQFAAQLPNVASTVFSTFSRVIKGNSPAPPANEQQPSVAYGAYDSPHEFQNTSHPYGGPAPPAASLSLTPLINSAACDPSASYQASTSAVDAAAQQLQAQSVAVPSLPLPPPPTFYNPEQVGSAGSGAVPPPSAVGLSNTYRLGGSKKKTYAHIPGLSSSVHPTGAVLQPAAPAAPQNAPIVPLPFEPKTTPYPADAQQTSAGVFPFASESSTVLPAAPPLEVNIPEPPPVSGTKEKPSLFGIIPTKIFDKLPKPSFGAEKKEERSEIVESTFVSGPPQGIVPHGSSTGAFFAPPLTAGVSTVPTQSQAVASLFAPTAPPASESGNHQVQQPVASNLLGSSPQPPPPTFYSPGQIPTVPVAAPSASSLKSNPYSSARRAAGVGPYKNPLAPVVAPLAGSVFLPNQLPPSAAQTQLLQAHSSEAGKDSPTVPALTPGVASLVPQTPVSIFYPVDPASAGTAISTPEKVEEITSTYVHHQVHPTATLVPTFPGAFTAGGPNVQPVAPTSIFNPLASVQNNQSSSADVTSPLPYPPVSSADSVFPPRVSQQNQQQFAQVGSFGGSTNLPSGTGLETQNPWQAQFNSFHIPSSCSPGTSPQAPLERLEFPQSTSEPSTSFTQFVDKDTPAVATKPIADSRSRSSENVLLPPPRPNSNLSEPAAIFPGFVPPANIFRSDTDASPSDTVVFPNSGSARNQPEQRQTQGNHHQAVAQDGNNPLDFFSGTSSLATVKPLVESERNVEFFIPTQQEQAPHKPFSLPQSVPAINPTDFFNSSSTVLPQEPATESAIKTGQTISSVPLFNFFGRTVDPVPTPSAVSDGTRAGREATLLGERLQPQDHADGLKVVAQEEVYPASGKSVAASTISNVSSFSNVQDRFEFGGAEEDGGDQEGEPSARENAANEPIFSSGNLFDFKSSVYQDGGFYSLNAGQGPDANDGNSSMAAMATTSVGAPDTTTNTAGTSIAESGNTNIAYRPTYNHWFYRREVEGKVLWSAFTMADSLALEDGLALAGAPSGENDGADSAPPPVIVHTDGGRYDVSIRERQRTPVYWNGPSNEVRRCSWFYKNVDSRFVPYEEDVAELLEREYKEASTSGEWHRRVTIPNGETVVFHGPSVIVHFLQTQNPDSWGSSSSPVPSTTNRPRVVKRGIDEFNIDDDEPEKIDHLLFMVHGIGEACDLRFRRVEEVVDEFRSLSAQLVQSHYRSSFDRGDVGRVEILPISWHDDLHSVESGVDEKLKSITLDSIPKLRHFTNDTLLDVLFYTSPMFCQSIIDAVGNSLNRLFTLFCQRNPTFDGRVSLAGHSLGSLILFDLLCHQKKTDQKQPTEPENSENPDGDAVPPLSNHHAHVHHRPLVRKCSQQINYEVGPAGTGQPYITYPQLLFEPKMFFALGSPIGMFVTIRGIDALGLDFKLPTCDGFFNIFHPYDPVAYRIEALINPDLSPLRPVLIPHHKGRKRMHLELKETMVRVSNDLKQRVSDVFRNTLDTVWALTAMSSRPDQKTIQKEVDKVLQDQLKFETTSASSNLAGGSDVDNGETSLPLGQLNQTRRVDYVLQEAPFEFINEYLFALTSHVCYWDSEDTMLFVMKEIYSSLGVQSDIQVPQQSMTIERPLAGTSPVASNSNCSLNSNYNLFPQSNNR